MSLRKIAGLLAAFALALGLIQAGVGASFTDQVTANQNINVGTFQCKIISAAPVAAVVADDGKSVTYSAPTITSSAPGRAPFSFTVQNTGSINQVLTVAPSSVSSPWSIINAPFAPVPLAANGTQTFDTGIAWSELNNSNLGQGTSVTWTVTCGENAPAVVFDNHPAALPANLPSIGPEAYSYNEFGAQVQLAGSARKLTSAIVTMSSWACQSGDWNHANCVSAAGATFDAPITFNVYNVGANNAVGSLIATKTQTFTLPYRPSTDSTHCTSGRWYDGATCFNGKAANITFSFAGQALPDKVIFGIAYNSDNHGYSPLHGTGSPIDSLNIAMNPGPDDNTVAVAPAVGSFLPDGLSAYLNDSYAGFYLDNGAAGLGSFRLDTGASLSGQAIGPYGGYEAAVQIVANY